MGSIGLFASMLWGSIPSAVKFGAIGLVAGVLVISGVYLYGVHNGRQDGRQAALQQSLTIFRQKAKTDAEISNMSDSDLCRALGGRMSDDGTQCL